MKHARDDYNGRFVDITGQTPEDEPVFLLRGKDPLAAQAVAYYGQLLAEAGASEAMIESTMEQAAAMDAWEPGKDRTVPDMPAGE